LTLIGNYWRNTKIFNTDNNNNNSNGAITIIIAITFLQWCWI